MISSLAGICWARTSSSATVGSSVTYGVVVNSSGATGTDSPPLASAHGFLGLLDDGGALSDQVRRVGGAMTAEVISEPSSRLADALATFAPSA